MSYELLHFIFEHFWKIDSNGILQNFLWTDKRKQAVKQNRCDIISSFKDMHLSIPHRD
jgi:hypothetical protein